MSWLGQITQKTRVLLHNKLNHIQACKSHEPNQIVLKKKVLSKFQTCSLLTQCWLLAISPPQPSLPAIHSSALLCGSGGWSMDRFTQFLSLPALLLGSGQWEQEVRGKKGEELKYSMPSPSLCPHCHLATHLCDPSSCWAALSPQLLLSLGSHNILSLLFLFSSRGRNAFLLLLFPEALTSFVGSTYPINNSFIKVSSWNSMSGMLFLVCQDLDGREWI